MGADQWVQKSRERGGARLAGGVRRSEREEAGEGKTSGADMRGPDGRERGRRRAGEKAWQARSEARGPQRILSFFFLNKSKKFK